MAPLSSFKRIESAPDLSGRRLARMVSSSAPDKPTKAQVLKSIFLSPMCILLVCAPLGVISYYAKWGATPTFIFNFIAMVPLAKILGDATEELAASLHNDLIAGLLNATFGNAVEMIMTVAFLGKHEYLVVKSTLLGSVLSNMLLVLGCSFLAGGLVARNVVSPNAEPLMGEAGPGTERTIRDKEQKFTKLGALANTTMLLVSCLVFCLITAFCVIQNIDDEDDTVDSTSMQHLMGISRICSFIVCLAYVAYIFFTMFTHAAAMGEDEGGEEEDDTLGLMGSLILLFMTTCVVAFLSELLSDSFEEGLKQLHIGKSFTSIILVPIVGNACEHAAAIRFAMQEKAGMAVGIAIGSSVQIALFVTPFSVITGWAMGDCIDKHKVAHNMDLDFGPLNAVVLTLSVIIVLSIVVDGKSNWLEGYMLVTAYVIIAVLYWYVPDHRMLHCH